MSPPHFPIGPDRAAGLMGARSRSKPAPTSSASSRSRPATSSTRAAGRSGTACRATARRSRTCPTRSTTTTTRSSRWRRTSTCSFRGTPFVTAERERADLFGHGTVEHAVEIARAGRRQAARAHAPLAVPHRRRRRSDRENGPTRSRAKKAWCSRSDRSCRPTTTDHSSCRRSQDDG